MFRSPLHLVAVLVAVLLGIVSLVVGGRILLGYDQAGYVVVGRYLHADPQNLYFAPIEDDGVKR